MKFLFLFLAVFSIHLSASAELSRFYQVQEGIYRGDQPDTVADYKILQSVGIRTIINLRNDDSAHTEKQIAAELGIMFVHVPLSTFKIPSDRKIALILEAMNNPNLQPVYVHCQYGKDRTGLVIGLHRVLNQKWRRRDAFKEMLSIGFSPFLVNLQYYFFSRTRDEQRPGVARALAGN